MLGKGGTDSARWRPETWSERIAEQEVAVRDITAGLRLFGRSAALLSLVSKAQSYESGYI